MGTGRCPHHVRHSTFDRKTQKMVFRDHCGLLVKKANPGSGLKSRRTKASPQNHRPAAAVGTKAKTNDNSLNCDQLPFASTFNYMTCPTYQAIFKSGSTKNNALPTNNFHSSQFTGSGLGDLDIL